MKNQKRQISFEDFLLKYAAEEWIFLIKSYISKRKIKTGERIFSEGEKVNGVFFINSGKVKVISSYDQKNERILRFSHEGDLLGHRAFTSTIYPISAIALTDVEITFIPKEIFIKLLKANPDFSLYLVEFVASELHQTEERMKSMIHHEVIIRLGVIFCMLIDAYGYEQKKSKKLTYALTRSDLANFAGTTYESVIRNLTKLEEMKLVKIDNKDIFVLNEKELRAFISNAGRGAGI